RGPGGTLWGANAVNGVINVITKSSTKTKGSLVSAGAGSEEKGFGTFRYGDQAGGWDYRAYGKYFNRDSGYRRDGANIDEWNMAKAGFRTDKEQWTIQGDFYNGAVEQRTNVISFTSPLAQTVDERADIRGANLLAKYTEEDWSLQVYWDETLRDFLSFKELRDRIDAEYLRRHQLTDNQELSWGLGYKLELEDIKNTETFSIQDPSEPDQVFSFFTQDEVSMTDDFTLIFGSKFEHNIYTGFEVQPNVRALYHISDQQQLWSAVSHSVRTPSRIHTNGIITGYSTTTGNFTRISPNDDVDAENITSYEIGYRNQPMEKAFFDVAAYSNYYKDLISFTRGSTITDRGQTVTLFPVVNGMSGEVYGIETSGEVRLLEWWKLKGNLAWSRMMLHTDDDVTNLGLERGLETAVPKYTAYLQSSYDLPKDVKFDHILRYVDAARSASSYLELDIVVSKTLNEWDFSLVGQNLVHDHHREAVGATATEIERGGYVKVTRKF
ncbi:MAG: outer membrane beta-barrel protein, partial [Candidatus Omnitrophica bacterium]|nr:outer membrane beta-barrel protein [Candidatus Omnitrophota bacterium]